MIHVSMTVNDALVTAEIEPRLHLGDFLRDIAGNRSVHLGCEHGACGACMVLIDEAPVRSCVILAAACEDKSVTTLEGLESDDTMAGLRKAFSTEHALQCGYCTPGMLMTARDIVRRLPAADEGRIRREFSGNMCRCTGYVGIVRATKSVIDEAL